MTTTAGPPTQLVRRTARLRPPSVPEGPVAVAAPPRVDTVPAGAAGWLQFLFPVVGSLGGMLFIVNNPKPLFVASGLFFMLSSIGMGVGMGAQQRLAARRRTFGARTKYLEYLGGLRSDLQNTADAQRASSRWRYPAPDALLALVRSPARLWERRPGDADFLLVRVGKGRQPLATPLGIPVEGGPAQASDPVCVSAADELLEAYGWIDEEAIGIDLRSARVLSILGPRAVRLDLARAVCCQLAVLHAPEEVRLVLSSRSTEAPDWEWIKWLPHLRGVQHGADGESSAVSVNDPAALEALVSSRAARARKVQAGADLLDTGPWLVVLADGVLPTPEAVSLLRRVPSRTTLVVLAGSQAEEPNEVDVRVRVASGRLRVEHVGAGGSHAEGRADSLGPHSAEAVARRLAPLRLSEEPGARLADTISLTDLLGVGDIGALDPALAWRRRPLAESLRVPIGVSSDGEAVVLDLKESAMGGDGPHGLVIGATGSGKSELLRTIVTGLALTHPPDLLAFVLADFKGGAAFAGLQELPHVAGLITNLANDLAMVDRMHAALFGEIRRRQELLRSAGNLASLRDYQHRLAEGQPLPPLPYLLVLVDEFGELLASRPDFIDLFVAVGRLGRSLGMHLLLSSQQLDEGRLRGLEGHLSYRIAMRTFSAAESRIVLGVPDAYELPPIPGSAYLKVGTTVYKRFRAALVSQVYSPPSESTAGPQRPREFRRTNDAVVAHAPLPDPDLNHQGPTLLEVVVPHLRDAAAKAHQIWLPPLEPRVGLDAILSASPHPRSTPLSVPIGLVDKPAEQKRDVLVADLSGAAGHLLVVGASLTGKTTLLRTLVASFALTHTPLEAQFYCIDYGGGGLSALAGLPHVGGVAGRQDPELVRRTVASVAALVDDRESQFKAAGIDSLDALRSRRGKGKLEGDGWADVFLVVDNWPALRQEFEELEVPLLEIAARGLGYGVHLVMTANRWIDVRSSLRESMGGRLELRLNDPTESAVNRKAAENVPKGLPGRGITAESLHFQTALPRIDGSVDVLDQQRGLEELVAGVAGAWRGQRARPVLVLPGLVAIADLPKSRKGGPGGVPIGVSERDLGVVRLDLVGGDPHFLVFGDVESGKTNVLRTFLRGLMSGHSSDDVQVLVVDYRRTLLGVVPPDYLLGYAGAEPAASAQLAETVQVLTRRLPPADLSIERLRARNWWHGPEVYVVADDYDLVATPSGNPLLPLLPLLAQAKDVGLHVLLARRTGGASRGILEQLMLRLRELGTPGLLLSGDPQEGALLASFRSGVEPPGRGLLVRRHERPSLIQVALSEAPTSSE
jgi:DNA segregation ATPase FtsK/SpoIIIE, S-DNA-T family